MANKREIRTSRLEDWEGNIYRLEGVDASGSSGGGSNINSDSIVTVKPGDPNLQGGGTQSLTGSDSSTTTEGSIIGDAQSSTGTAIMIAGSTEKDKSVFAGTFTNFSFGRYALAFRMKSSKNTPTDTIMRVNVYYVDLTGSNAKTLLSTHYVYGAYFSKVNSYENVIFTIDYNGIHTTSCGLRIECIIDRNTNLSITLDNITVTRSSIDVLINRKWQNVFVSKDGWIEKNSVFTKDVDVNGMLPEYCPVWAILNNSGNIDIIKKINKISIISIETKLNSISITCMKKPEVDFTLLGKGV